MIKPFRLSIPLLIAIIALVIAACSFVVDRSREAKLRNKARQAAAGDMPLHIRPDLSLPAFLEIDYDGQWRTKPHQPLCGGYCLRLLYTGEAKTVISGFAIPDPEPGCIKLSKGEAFRKRDFKSQLWLPLDTCETLDLTLSEIKDSDPPIFWRGEDDNGQAYIVWARAYHVEKRKHCPGTHYADTLLAFPNNLKHDEDLALNTELMVGHHIAANQCLIETPIDIEAASAIFLFSYHSEENNDRKSWMHDTSITSKQLTVYGPASAKWPVIYRHTVSYYSFLPALAPTDSFDNLSFDVEKSSERKSLLDHVRSDFGFVLGNLPDAQIDLKEAVVNALDNPDLDFTSPNWKIVPDYLTSLKAKGQNGLDHQDASILAGLIADPRVTIQLRDLKDVIRLNPQAAPVLAEPLLKALDVFPYEVLSDGGAQLLGQQEDLRLLSQRSDFNDDLINAGSDRLDHIAAGLAALDDKGVMTQLPLYRKLVGDRFRKYFYPSIVEHMNLLAPDEALPSLRRMIMPTSEERSHQIHPDQLQESALKAACRMGDKAAPLLPDVTRFLKSVPSENDNSKSAEIAWAMLAHFRQADALASQLHPAQSYITLMASGQLSCEGWVQT